MTIVLVFFRQTRFVITHKGTHTHTKNTIKNKQSEQKKKFYVNLIIQSALTSYFYLIYATVQRYETVKVGLSFVLPKKL